MAQAMAQHAAARQSVIAENVANADTPGYKARDLASFGETFRAGRGSGLRATRAGHVPGREGLQTPPIPSTAHRPGAAAPNGNTVSLEQEIFASAEAQSQHETAMAIYKSALSILRTSASARS